MLPFTLDAVTKLLAGYERDDLVDAVHGWADAQSLLLAVLGRPDLLSAWALTPGARSSDGHPSTHP